MARRVIGPRSRGERQISPRRVASATADAPEPRPELRADVRHVPVHGVGAHDECAPRSARSVSPARRARGPRARGPRAGRPARRRRSPSSGGAEPVRSACATAGASPTHGRCALPASWTSVAPSIPAARSARRARRGSPGRRAGGRHRRRAHLLELRADVRAVDQLQQRRGRLPVADCCWPRVNCSRSLVLVAQEHVGEHARAEPPVRADRGDDRLAHLDGRDRDAPRRSSRTAAAAPPARAGERRTRCGAAADGAADQRGALEPSSSSTRPAARLRRRAWSPAGATSRSESPTPGWS